MTKRFTTSLCRIDTRIINGGIALALSVILSGGLAPTASAAKAAPRDATPPSSISDLQVSPSVRALALRFTAVGDDGLTGQSTGYEVRYLASTADPCPVNADAWTAAPRWRPGAPRPSGYADSAVIHPLPADTRYCVAIKALDEASNSSPNWAVSAARTAPGAWSTTSLSVGSSARAYGVRAVADPDAPAASPRLLTAWLTLDPTGSVVTGIGFAAVDAPGEGDAPLPLDGCVAPATINCVQTISATDPLLSVHFDKLHNRFDIASIPGADVAALVVNGSVAAGKTRVIRTVLLERHEGGGWTSELLPFVVDDINPVELGSNVAYVAGTDADPGVVPALTSVRRNADSTRTTESTKTLLLWERYGGSWQSTELFSRASPFYERKLLANADGSLAVWANQYGAEPSVFAERALDGTWTWRDAGPRFQNSAGQSSYGYSVGRDRQGELAVATAAYQSKEVMMLRATAFIPLLGGPPGIGATSRVGMEAWTLVADNPTEYDSTGGYREARVMGVWGEGCIEGADVRVGFQLLEPGYYYEQRLLDVFDNASPAPAPLAIDQNYGGGRSPSLVVLADGDPVFAYASGFGADGAEFVRLTRGDIGACDAPPAPPQL